MTNRLLAAALAAGFSLSPLTHAGTYPDDVPALGYSPANRDTRVDPRQDFYRYAAGNWLKKTEIAPSDPDVGGFTLLAHNLDKQLLTLIKDAAAATDAPKGIRPPASRRLLQGGHGRRAPLCPRPASRWRPICSASPRQVARRPTTAVSPAGYRTRLAARR